MSRASLTFLLAAVLTLAGCGSDQAEPAATEEPSATAPSTAEPTEPEPSATPSSSPSSSAKPRHGGRQKVGSLGPNARVRRTPPDAHLLAVDELPRVAGTWSMTVADGGESDPVVGACQKTGLGTIGAEESVLRSYTAKDATAVQVVARFVDPRSAWRAHAVLKAWREDCAERVGGASVGDLEEVAVRVGNAHAYRADYRRRSTGFGILRRGPYLAVVEITSPKYPTGWAPQRVALRRIAKTF